MALRCVTPAFMFLLFCGALTVPFNLWAQGKSDSGEVMVRIRTVRATGVREMNAPATAHLSVDDRIRDVQPNLRQLPYGNFKLVSSDRVTVPIMKKQKINLRGGQTLSLRLHYINQGRMGIWLKWKDSGGMKLIDTRLHFNSSEPVVLAEDSPEGGSQIIVINVVQ